MNSWRFSVVFDYEQERSIWIVRWYLERFTCATAAINNLQWSIVNVECRSNERDNSVSLSKTSRSFSSISFFNESNQSFQLNRQLFLLSFDSQRSFAKNYLMMMLIDFHSSITQKNEIRSIQCSWHLFYLFCARHPSNSLSQSQCQIEVIDREECGFCRHGDEQ